MKAPTSKAAIYVKQHAKLSCKIWYVCNQTLVSIRYSTEENNDLAQMLPSRNYQSLDQLQLSENEDVPRNSSLLPMPKDEESEEGSVVFSSEHMSDGHLQISFSDNELEDIDAEVYDKLQEALTEVKKLRHESYEESIRCQKAEEKAKTLEELYAKEMNRRKQIEEALAREKREVEVLKQRWDEISEQLQNANKRKYALEHQIADCDSIVKYTREKLSVAEHRLTTLQREHEKLQLERDALVRETEELRRTNEQVTTRIYRRKHFLEFSYSEIDEATHGFRSSQKIGEGGFGSVYKGFLRNTTVAIKMLNPESMQGQSEFQQEVDVLYRVRHPNLVTLIGACPEACALIYEFLSNGSLEDRLDCKNNTPPLTWQVRTRIAKEICSALIFLHSTRPHPVVHGDLKPANILLDANFTSKLGDFGISRILVQSNSSNTSFYRYTHPRGTFAYMDPELSVTGKLTPKSDVYSFGVIILQLLTGKPALGLIKEVQEASDKGCLQLMIDPAVRNWPFVKAKQLARLGLWCCEMNQKSRPDLAGEVLRVLNPMSKAALSSMSLLSVGTMEDDDSRIPNHFLCPIFQEIMRDPHVAADGFTYEAEALRGWLDGGHNTSPMTNVRLPNCELIPNRALRSAIQEWMQQQQQL